MCVKKTAFLDFDLSEVESMDLDEGAGTIVSSDGGDLVVCEGGAILEPYEGMEFESEDAAKTFYDEYARQVGFIMRVMSCRRSEVDGRILARRLGCNKEGVCVSTRGKFGPVRKRRPSTREGCKAMILVKVEKSGKWVITRFVKDHNHPLVVSPRECRHILGRINGVGPSKAGSSRAGLSGARESGALNDDDGFVMLIGEDRWGQSRGARGRDSLYLGEEERGFVESSGRRSSGRIRRGAREGPEPSKGVSEAFLVKEAQELRRSSSGLRLEGSWIQLLPEECSKESQRGQVVSAQGEEDHCSWDLRILRSREDSRVAEREIDPLCRYSFLTEAGSDFVTPNLGVRKARVGGWGRGSPTAEKEVGVVCEMGDGHRVDNNELLVGRFWDVGSEGSDLDQYTPLVFGELGVEKSVSGLCVGGVLSGILGPDANGAFLGPHFGQSLAPVELSRGEVSEWVVNHVESVGKELGVSTDGCDSEVRSLYRRLEGRKEEGRGCPTERQKDEKDRKIQELTAELRRKKRLCATYREQLRMFMKDVEQHTEQISTTVQVTVNNLREVESEEQDSSHCR
ncbi:hypothetical protein HHK36_027264 [Tetracentron sinense]|uniref:FAR1 domain-containing protein n=1 Tax=Tetracentron sinense TaxID=13715 RepID=A0A834YH39_TETSI|nr:hypothetical protein HHK36_027264 [Tetracentron sinense]